MRREEIGAQFLLSNDGSVKCDTRQPERPVKLLGIRLFGVQQIKRTKKYRAL